MQRTSWERSPRSSPANAYSDSVFGIGVTAARIVAGSAPMLTATGNRSPGCFFDQAAKSVAPPRCASQRMITRLRPMTCWR